MERKVKMADKKGLIFDIQGFSVHDGPGCRTLIFLKGCPMRCRWCCNPEGIDPHIQVMYHQQRCAKDYACKKACKYQAIHIESPGAPVTIDRTSCYKCTGFNCTAACEYSALDLSGYYMTVEELMKKIQNDRNYWGASGGVTLSGGEPLFQYEFTRTILQQCYDSYIHTALETSGFAPWEHLEIILDYIEWIFYDLKHMDPRMHRIGTGQSNKLILDNARKIAAQKEYRLIFRMPIIPGFNDSLQNIIATAEFINNIGGTEINILPMHHLGSSKYDLLGLKYYYEDNLNTPSIEQMKEIRDLFTDYSIKCFIGSDTPF
jgi:pyruvate formate lyase activating enzyme